MSFHPSNFGAGVLLTRRPSPPDKEPFVYVPLSWIRRAACLPCRSAVQAALLVWFRKSVTGSNEFGVSNVVALSFGLDRKQKAAGLKSLAKAGMITLHLLPGRSPWVVMPP